MKYWEKVLKTDDDLFNGVSVQRLAEFTKIAQPTLSNIKNNSFIISENYYKKLRSQITEFKAKTRFNKKA